jgi:hypothetical protein
MGNYLRGSIYSLLFFIRIEIYIYNVLSVLGPRESITYGKTIQKIGCLECLGVHFRTVVASRNDAKSRRACNRLTGDLRSYSILTRSEAILRKVPDSTSERRNGLGSRTLRQLRPPSGQPSDLRFP